MPPAITPQQGTQVVVGDKGTPIYIRYVDDASDQPIDTSEALELVARVKKPDGSTEFEITFTAVAPGTERPDKVIVNPEDGWAVHTPAPSEDFFDVAGTWRFAPRYQLDADRVWHDAKWRTVRVAAQPS